MSSQVSISESLRIAAAVSLDVKIVQWLIAQDFLLERRVQILVGFVIFASPQILLVKVWIHLYYWSISKNCKSLLSAKNKNKTTQIHKNYKLCLKIACKDLNTRRKRMNQSYISILIYTPRYLFFLITKI